MPETAGAASDPALDEAIETTLLAYEPLGIAKPRLTRKLLKRPPFRFIYDLFNSIRTKTGLSEGLLTDEELAGDFSKKGSKEARVACMRKMIAFVQYATNEDLGIKCENIMAGVEVKQTNVLLQALAKAASDTGVDSPAIVEAIKTSLPPKPKSPAKAKAEEEAAAARLQAREDAAAIKRQAEEEIAAIRNQAKKEAAAMRDSAIADLLTTTSSLPVATKPTALPVPERKNITLTPL